MVTDQDVYSDVQSFVAEPLDGGVTWPSGMWTPAEVRGYFDAAQLGLVAETALILKRVVVPCTPHLLRQELPADLLAIQRLVWVRTSDNRHFVLDSSDIWELDCALANWRTVPGTPGYYTTGDVPTRTVQIVPAPAVPGVLKLTYLAIPTLSTGAGVAADVPDDASVVLVWGTVCHMLVKEGRAKDPARAAYADGLSKLATEAIKLILRGWET